MQTVFAEREAMWVVQEVDKVHSAQGGFCRGGNMGKECSLPSRGVGTGLAAVGTAGQVRTADTTKDGKAICSGYNMGRCKKDICPQGKLHACNGLLKESGRVCGLKNHISLNCKSALRH